MQLAVNTNQTDLTITSIRTVIIEASQLSDAPSIVPSQAASSSPADQATTTDATTTVQ